MAPSHYVLCVEKRVEHKHLCARSPSAEAHAAVPGAGINKALLSKYGFKSIFSTARYGALMEETLVLYISFSFA